MILLYIFLDFFSFSNQDTKLTIHSNAFQYINDDFSYEFLVIGQTNYASFRQLVKINVVQYNYIPIVNLGYKIVF